MLGRLVIIAVLAASFPSLSSAQCRIAVAGTACVAIPKATAPRPGPVEIGEVLDRGEYSMLMNATYYGLPRVSDGWVYMRIENDIYRVDWRSHKVLERVTHQASRNWR
ncbi:hypothetical protein SLH49_17195 [Cognatiyoonia sp. IB215446]|uniref:hypothetical protein n=1 Tax=Cognatiyoonia sp. IB215446 TaxID=3097355 RepID=UPI002A16D5C0|nr:hypothetical protein [Cognatiyoonia sp. IB215446]MDX8349724.1 hypothetical protein [Cognatiyoonia sp. IB215446]